MLRDQVINFLQAAVIFLLLTNAASAVAAAYAMRLASQFASGARKEAPAPARRLEAFLRRSA